MKMNKRPIGRCSNCGGVVSVYQGAWYGINPPQPTCESCGAVANTIPNKIIDMTPPRIPTHIQGKIGTLLDNFKKGQEDK